MIDQFFASFKVLGKENSIKSTKLLIILILAVFLELLGIGLIVPILSNLFNVEQTTENFKIIYYLLTLFPQGLSQLVSLSIIFLLIIIFKICLLLYFDYKTQKYTREMFLGISLKAYSYFLYAPWEDVLRKDHGYIIRNILSDTSRFIGQGILQFIYIIKNTLFLIFVLGYLFYINFEITFFVFLLFSTFTIIFLLLLKKKLENLSSITAGLDKFRFKNISETVIGLRDVKLLGNPKYFLNLFKINEEKTTKITIITTILNKIPRYFLELMIVLGVVLTISYLDINNINIIDFVPLIGLYGFAILRLVPVFINYNVNIQAIKYSKTQIDEVIKNASRFSKFYNQNILNDMGGSSQKKLDFEKDAKINISDVSFSYDKKKYIFKSLNLEIVKDKTIYIEGENGSGKSTLVDLISGMLSPITGKVLFNNQNIQNFKEEWQNHIGYVSQTYFLINSSIKDNIIFGRKNISEDKLKNIIKTVELETLINSLPEGIETKVGNLGGKLSGGQKQRIVIARALINNPNIIILDEATNALDNETEENLLKILNKIKIGKIIIFIAHSEKIKNFCDINLLIKDNNIQLNYEKKNY